KPFTVVFRSALAVPPVKQRNDSGKGGSGARVVRVFPYQDQVLNLAWKLLERGLQIKFVNFRRAGQTTAEKTGACSRAKATLEQRPRPILDNFRWIESIVRAQPFAGFAGAINTVERERAGLERRDVDAAFHAGRFVG